MLSNAVMLVGLRRLACLGITVVMRRSPEHPSGTAEPPNTDKMGSYGILNVRDNRESSMKGQSKRGHRGLLQEIPFMAAKTTCPDDHFEVEIGTRNQWTEDEGQSSDDVQACLPGVGVPVWDNKQSSSKRIFRYPASCILGRE